MVFASAYRKTTGASTLKTGHVCGSLLIRGWKREMEGGSVMARTIGCAVLLWCRTSDASLHEPRVWSPGFSRSGPPEGGTPYRWHDPDGFMVPMHGRRPRGFSMNRTNAQSTREPKAAEHRRTPRRWRVGHRGPKIPALRKAALKRRAVQTLTRGPLTRPQARSVWSASDLSALSLRRGPTVDGPNAQYKSVGLSVLKIIRCKNWRGRLTCKP